MTLAEDLAPTSRKVLVLDIETSPNLAYVWSLWERGGLHITPDKLTEHSTVICWAAKWVGEPQVMFASDHHTGHHTSMERAHQLVDEADIIVGYNHIGFDMTHLAREWLLGGLPPPRPHKDVDLYRVVKRRFAFASNGLGHVAPRLQLGGKLHHVGFGMWRRCMDGDPAAWNEMGRYNVADVLLTESLYLRVLPWIHNHPHVAPDRSRLLCNKCGSPDLEGTGVYTAVSRSYAAYRCRQCGGHVRAAYESQRIASTVGV
jgi:hypothetical protein